MKRILATVLIIAAMIAAQAVHAEDKAADVTDMQALRDAARTDESKKAFVASVLKLTPDEAKKFWPIYEQYQDKLEAAGRIRTIALKGIIEKDGRLTNLQARSLAGEFLRADQAELTARAAMQRRLLSRVPTRGIIPWVKAERYMQLESKFRAVQAYDIAATIPLVR